MSITSGLHRKKRVSVKPPAINPHVNHFLLALQENDGHTPKIFIDGERYMSAPPNEPNQTQVHFDMGNDGSPRCIRFRLNSLEDETLVAFQQVMLNYLYLNDLRLEFCGLSYDQLLYVRMIVQENPQIVHLSINGNPSRNAAEEEGHHLPIHGTHLKMFSLQLCSLTPMVAKLFAYALSKPDKYTRNLVDLNLGCNKLGDEGCALIAGILRSNRFLQALNISENQISASALVELFDGLQKFRLTASEVRYKRHIKIAALMKETFPDLKTRERRNSMSSKSTSASSSYTVVSTDSILAGHPFITDTVQEEESFVCAGNNTLLHINISYNEITANVLETIIDTISYQKKNFKSGGLQRVLAESRKQFPDLILEMNQILSNVNKHNRTHKRPSSSFN